MAIGVPGLRAEPNSKLLKLIVTVNLRKCRATILTVANFQNTLKLQG